jgi:hypothetical protein
MEYGVGHPSFDESRDLEALFMPSVVKYLHDRPDTLFLREANKFEQLTYDIDLYWTHSFAEKELETSVEVKVDGQGHQTGNFAFETVSNKQADTRGCFLRTEADEMYYLLAGSGNLFRWKTNVVREWFLDNRHKFREVTPQTPGGNGRKSYSSTCSLVPVRLLTREMGTKIAHSIIPVPPLPERYGK